MRVLEWGLPKAQANDYGTGHVRWEFYIESKPFNFVIYIGRELTIYPLLPRYAPLFLR